LAKEFRLRISIFRGMSGGLMLTVIQNRLRSWSLAGVIYQGPNTSADEGQAIAGLEVIRARRAHFILPDGRLDVARWKSLTHDPSLVMSLVSELSALNLVRIQEGGIRMPDHSEILIEVTPIGVRLVERFIEGKT
jgi:hypothetical protein